MQTLVLETLFERREGYYRCATPFDFAKVDVDKVIDAYQRLDDATAGSRAGAPLRVLCDVRGTTNAARADRRPMYRRHHEFDHRRVAVLGDSRIHQILFDFIVAATAHRGNARYFVDEATAVAWLRGDDGR